MPCRMPKNRLSPEESSHMQLNALKRITASIESIESIIQKLRLKQWATQEDEETQEWHSHHTLPEAGQITRDMLDQRESAYKKTVK